MAYSLNIDRYPSQFLAIAQKLCEESAPVHIPCPDTKTAHAMRFRLNAFRKALEAHPELARQLSQFIGSVIKLSSDKTTVIIEPVDNSEIAQLLDSVIQSTVQSPAPVSQPAIATAIATPEPSYSVANSTESLVNSYLLGDKK